MCFALLQVHVSGSAPKRIPAASMTLATIGLGTEKVLSSDSVSIGMLLIFAFTVLSEMSLSARFDLINLSKIARALAFEW